MSFIDLFPTVILQETLNNITDSDIGLYKEFFKKELFINSGTDGIDGCASLNQKILSNSLFKKLHNSILDLSLIYLKEIGHTVENTQICNSWVNLLNTHEGIHLHKHSNSYISGVFYLESSSPIDFYNPITNFFTFSPKLNKSPNSHRNSQTFRVFPKPNNILLFPSWLLHEASPSKEDNRISIAFNIIPKGEFGDNTSKLYL